MSLRSAFPTPPPSVAGGGSAPLDFVRGLVRELGDVARYESDFGPIHFFNHPDHVQAILQSPNYERTPLITAMLGQGLLSSDGRWWRGQRRLIQPHFQERCLPGFGPIIVETVRDTLRRWEPWMESGTPVDLVAEMQRVSLEVIVRAFFSMEIGEAARELCEAVTSLLNDLSGINGPAFRLASSVTPARNAAFRSSLQRLDAFVYRLLEERRALRDPPRDLLALLLAARDAGTGQPLSDVAIRDEIVTMIVAGHEATAITLVWAWHLIAEHPATEEALAAEIGDKLPGIEDLPRLATVRAVLDETMRLYPPVWFMMRRAEAAGAVAGVPLPAGAIVAICPYTTHRHADFWQDAERFDPTRFAPGAGERHRFAYLPFSGGRHHCIGSGFAAMELPLVIAGLASRCRVRPITGGMPEPAAGLTLRARAPCLVLLERR